MRKEPTRLSFDEFAENLASVLDRVIRDSETVVVEKLGAAIAVTPISSARTARRRREKSDADYQAFLSSAGGWNGLVDTDALKKAIAESHAMPARPRVEL